MDNQTKFVSQRQLSIHLNCAPHELIRYREKGIIKPHHRDGKRIFYDLIRTEVELIKNLNPGYAGKMRDICKADIKAFIEKNPQSDIAIMFAAGSKLRSKVFDDEKQDSDDDDILNYNASRALYEYNKAKIKEMERLEKENQLVKVSEVKKIWEKHIVDIKSQLTNLPSKIVATLSDLDRDRAISVRKKIDIIIKDALKELGN